MPKVLLIIGSGTKAVAEMFKGQGWEITTEFDDADLVQFVGGEDVDPSLYGQHKHKSTRSNLDRDQREANLYAMALDQGIPMAGICRGGQFLNVMNGGKLWQDVDGHAVMGSHEAWVANSAGLSVRVTSTHHQMMEPNYFVESKILLTARESTRKWSMSEDTSALKYESVSYSDRKSKRATDIESIFYPGTRCLCFQPHPEFTSNQDTREVYFNFIENYLFRDESGALLNDAIPF